MIALFLYLFCRYPSQLALSRVVWQLMMLQSSMATARHTVVTHIKVAIGQVYLIVLDSAFL